MTGGGASTWATIAFQARKMVRQWRLSKPARPGTGSSPFGGKPERVTAALAGELTGDAFLFYRPLPARSISLRDFLVFGLTGCGREIGLIVLVGIAAGLLGLAAPLAFGALFDYVIPHAERKQIALLGALVGLSAVCTMLLRIAGGFATLRVEARIASSLQTALWDRLLVAVFVLQVIYHGDLARAGPAIDRIPANTDRAHL